MTSAPAERRVRRLQEGHSLAQAWYHAWARALSGGGQVPRAVNLSASPAETELRVTASDASEDVFTVWTGGRAVPWSDEMYSSLTPPSTDDAEPQLDARAAEGLVASILWASDMIVPGVEFPSLSLIHEDAETVLVADVGLAMATSKRRVILREAGGRLRAFEAHEAVTAWLLGP